MANGISEEEVREVIADVKHPAINCSLLDLGIVRDIAVTENGVTVTMAFPFPGIPIKDLLVESVRRPVEELGVDVVVENRLMTAEERAAFLEIEGKHWRGM